MLFYKQFTGLETKIRQLLELVFVLIRVKCEYQADISADIPSYQILYLLPNEPICRLIEMAAQNSFFGFRTEFCIWTNI